MRPTNLAFLRIAKRAERQDDDVLQKTFVDFGSVMTVVSSIDHQVIFGRRGTGKTHLLTVFRQSRRAAGEIAIQIDMRNLGSSGGIYADSSIPLPQRATRLLIDVLAVIHGNLLEQAIENDALINLGVTGSALDELFIAHSTVRVVGPTTLTMTASAENAFNAESKLGFSVSAPLQSFYGEAKEASSERETVTATKSLTGEEVARVNFGSVGNSLRRVVETLPKGKLWILIDEWSEVPLDLQPYLADLLRRAVLSTKGITVKIAAIEQRSRLLIPDAMVGHVGLELGADLSAAINLDDYMVFDNDETKAVAFFKALVLKHVQAALEPDGIVPPKDQNELITQGFTQFNAFHEVVRACEGVPRDAIHILSQAAQRSNDQTISVNDVRRAAQQWYQASKDAAVSAHEQAKRLLLWIVDKVIKERQTKAFLLESGTRDTLIDFLYDERVIHVLRKSMSAQDEPGKRFHVYGIDYGCYVDLINTARAPQGLLDLGESAHEFCLSVPKTDFRSIRRCVLNLADFYR
ncbi:MAG: ORC-CDC6 family AAA ATPase [Polaromonas sp.]